MTSAAAAEPRRIRRPLHPRAYALVLGVAALVTVVALLSLWRAQAKWRPHTITGADGARITALLNDAGWVSPGLKGPAVYMISFRSCPDCIRFEREQFPALQKAGVDTRVIMVARRRKSTPAERSGVAELWANRSWRTYEHWTDIPVAAWTAADLPSGDADPARAALVEKARVFAEALEPILTRQGVSERLHYPTLLWRDAKGDWRGCNCEDPRTYANVRRELGVTG